MIRKAIQKAFIPLSITLPVIGFGFGMISPEAGATDANIYLSSHNCPRCDKKKFPSACKFKISYVDGKNGNTDSCTFVGNDTKYDQGCKLNNWDHINDKDSRLTVGIIDGGVGKSIQDCYNANGARIAAIWEDKDKMPTIWDWQKGANSEGNACVNDFFEKENGNWSYAHLAGSKGREVNGYVMTSFTTGTKGGVSKRVKSCTDALISVQ